MQTSPSITERLANMPIWAVLVTIAVLVLIRFALLRLKTPATKSIAEIAESLAVAMGLVFLIIRPFIIQAFFIPSESMVPTLLLNDHIMVNKFIYRFREPARGDVTVFRAPPWASPDNQEKDFIKRVIGLPGDEVRIEPGFVVVGDWALEREELRELLSEKSRVGTVRIVSSKSVLADGHVVSPEDIAALSGQPNDRVTIVPGRVFINGKPIDEPYLNEDANERYPGETMWPADRKYVREAKDGKLVVKIPKGRLLMLGDNRNNSGDARKWGLLDRRRVLGKAMFIFWPLGRIRWVH